MIDNEGEALPDEPSNEARCLIDRQFILPPDRHKANFVHYEVPNTFQEADTGPNSEKWSDAIQYELNEFHKNDTWKIIPKSREKKPKDSKCVIMVHQDEHGNSNRSKARLYARGFQ